MTFEDLLSNQDRFELSNAANAPDEVIPIDDAMTHHIRRAMNVARGKSRIRAERRRCLEYIPTRSVKG